MSDSLSPGRQKEARELARLTRRLSLLELGLEGLLLLAFIFTGASIVLRSLLPALFPLQVGLYILIVGAAYGLLFSPLSYYQGFVLPRRYGLSHQPRRGWLVDQLKGWLLGLALGVIIGLAVYWLLSMSPQLWWLWAALFTIALSVLLTNLAPLLILPLFFKVQPLADPALAQRLEDLARRADTRVRGIFTASFSSKTTASNAGLMGLGPTRRIVVSDTLLQQYSPDEIEAVVAHELGHHRHGDIPRLIVVQSLFLLAAFYVTHLVLQRFSASLGFAGPADIANFPLLALTLGGLVAVVSPLLHAFTRRLEMAADSYALRLAGQPEAFISAMVKLTECNLSEATPPRWDELLFYDHPPYYKRKAQAEAYLTSRQSGVDSGKSVISSQQSAPPPPLKTEC